jgi:hypothetical protein
MGVGRTSTYGFRVSRRGVYLEVIYRRERALAAYLHLPRESRARVAHTRAVGKGFLVDYAGRVPVGIELPAADAVTGDDINAVLSQISLADVREQDWAPLRNANG